MPERATPLPPDSPKRVLLVEPTLFIHTGIHIKAAIGSAGYENAEFTLLVGVANQECKQRALTFEKMYPNLKVRLIEETEEMRLGAKGHWQANAHTLREVEELLHEEPFDLLIYLHSDFILLLFALPWSRRRFSRHFKTKVSGLLFRNNGFRPPGASLKGRLRALLERTILRRAIATGSFRQLAFLDPVAGAMAAAVHGPVCRPGIEPIDIEPVAPAVARKALGIAPEHYVGLIFGGLSGRKGVIEILSIFETADLDTDRITLVIAGPVAAPIRETLLALLERIRKRYTVHFHDGFVPDEAVPLYLASADCALCTYRDFNASSGVLLQTASLGKPAMVSEGGVMADAVRRFGFGEVVRLQEPAGYVEAFRRLMGLTPEERQAIGERARAYAATMDVTRYLSQYDGSSLHSTSRESNAESHQPLTC